MWAKLDGDIKWHYVSNRFDTNYSCGFERPRLGNKLAVKCCVMYVPPSYHHYPANSCSECLRFAQLLRDNCCILEERSPESKRLLDPPEFKEVKKKPLSLNRARLIILLDGFISDCYNKNTKNYDSGDGRYISFRTRFVNPDGTERIVAGKDHKDIWRWTDSEDALFDTEFDEQMVSTGHWKLGSHTIWAYHNLYVTLLYLENKHELNVKLAKNLKYDFSTYNVDYDAPLSRVRRQLLHKSINYITNGRAIEYTRKDGTVLNHLPSVDTEDVNVLMSGTMKSGANHVPIFRNLHTALCFLEANVGLRVD